MDILYVYMCYGVLCLKKWIRMDNQIISGFVVNVSNRKSTHQVSDSHELQQ